MRRIKAFLVPRFFKHVTDKIVEEMLIEILVIKCTGLKDDYSSVEFGT